MSMAALILRVVTVQALKGATMAGDKVLDAPVDPAQDADVSSAPVLAVYTGDESAIVEGRDLIGGDLEVALVVQGYLPAGVKVQAGGRTLAVDLRGAGAELALNVLERQIFRALVGAEGLWPELWRRFVCSISGATGQGFLLHKGTEDNKIRCAARELVLSVRPLCDPPFGEPLPELWLEALAAIRTLPELGVLADWIEAEAEGPANLADWQKDRASRGFTLGEIRALGLAPVDRPDAFPTVPVAGVTIGDAPAAPFLNTVLDSEALPP